jgi:hypothetical protein
MAPRKKAVRWMKANMGQDIHNAISVRNTFRALETCDDTGVVEVKGGVKTKMSVAEVRGEVKAKTHITQHKAACFRSGRSDKPLGVGVEHPVRDPPALSWRPAYHTEDNRGKIATTPDIKKARVQNAMSMLAEIRSGGDLCSMPEMHGKWEKLTAVVDSGAFVPVIPPTVGKEYKTQESAASKAGVTYKAANGGEIANVGEKFMPVVTSEGTMRGYCSQVAGVTQALQSVRHLNSSGHVVVFDGQSSFMVNKVSGEVNAITDDGSNFTMTMWIVPPDEVNSVAQQLDFQRQAP